MGILKAIGFSDGHVFRLLIGEPLMAISLFGAASPASDSRGCWPTSCTTTRNPTSSPSSICRLGRCSPPSVWQY